MRSKGYDYLSGEGNPEDRERSVESVEEFRKVDRGEYKKEFEKAKKSSFVSLGEEWSVTSGYFTPERQNTVIQTKIALDKTFKDSECINFSDQSGKQGDIMVVRRIGSDSAYGQVYLGSVVLNTDDPKYPMVENNVAIKVMPVFRPGIYNDNYSEIMYMKQLSQLVLDGKSVHFPVLYFDSSCKNTIMPIPPLPKGILPRRAANFGVIEELVERLDVRGLEKTDIEREIFKKSYQPTSEYIRAEFESTFTPAATVNDVIEKTRMMKSAIIDTNLVYALVAEKIGPYGMSDPRLAVNPAGHIRSSIIVMELAESDVRSKYDNGSAYTFKQSYDMMIQVMQGIIDMQRYFSLVHDDLHAGNVLIIKDIDSIGTVKTRYLLNDFGRTKAIENVYNVPVNDVRTMDIEKFSQVMRHYAVRNDGKSREYDAVSLMFQIAVDVIYDVRARPRRNLAEDMETVLVGFQQVVSDQLGDYLRGFKLYSPENVLPLEEAPPTTVGFIEPTGRRGAARKGKGRIEVREIGPKRRRKMPRLVFEPRRGGPRVKIINLRGVPRGEPIIISSSEQQAEAKEKEKREVGKVAKAMRSFVL